MIYSVRYSWVIVLMLLSCSGILRAQNTNVGIGTETPASSALLELSTTGKGLLVPRMTSSQKQAISAPRTGLLIFQNDSVSSTQPSTFYYYDGTAWVPIIGFDKGWQLVGNGGTNAGVNFLGTLDSIDLVNRTNNRQRFRLYAGGNLRLISQDTIAEQLQFSERQDSGSSITSFRARPMIQDVKYTLPDTQGGSYTFLTNDGSGNLFWSRIGGPTTYSITTITTFTTDQDNLALDTTKIIFRVSSSKNLNITGMANGWDGRYVVIINVGNAVVTLRNQDAGSLSKNQFLVGGGNSIGMQTNEAIMLIYDGTSQVWRPVAKSP